MVELASQISCFWWTRLVCPCLSGSLWMKMGTTSVVSGCSGGVLVHESLSWGKWGLLWSGLCESYLLHCYWCLCSTAESKSGDVNRLKTNCCFIRFCIVLFSSLNWLITVISVQKWDGNLQFTGEGVNYRNVSALTETVLNCHEAAPTDLESMWWMKLIFFQKKLLPLS